MMMLFIFGGAYNDNGVYLKVGQRQLLCGSDFHSHRHPCLPFTLEVHHNDHVVDADENHDFWPIWTFLGPSGPNWPKNSRLDFSNSFHLRSNRFGPPGPANQHFQSFLAVFRPFLGPGVPHFQEICVRKVEQGLCYLFTSYISAFIGQSYL